ncbi:MAG: TlyA family rRNA (cytidine-2'-O)-methyltransferase, partial [Rhodospirillales bacterium]|nr:TlyA family rRNA (cytidine-2'-O)-methyltransferase [Rhodospirillales bacterium]
MVDRGLAESRTRAQAFILAGVVFTGDRRVNKAGDLLSIESELTVRGPDHPWVSRGGIKLARALDTFAIDPVGLVCVDLGASDRGLHRRAAEPAGDPGVRDRRRTRPTRLVPSPGPAGRAARTHQARHLDPSHIPEPVDLIVVDVSFISLTLVLPPALALARSGARLVALIKPQFEAGRGQVGKGGDVRDAEVREQVCERICGWLGD